MTYDGMLKKALLLFSKQFRRILLSYSGPAEGEGLGGLQPPHFFENYKELLRKKCFQPPHFELLVSPPTFKVAARALLLGSMHCVINSLILTTKQLVLYWFCKEKRDVDQLDEAGSVNRAKVNERCYCTMHLTTSCRILFSLTYSHRVQNHRSGNCITSHFYFLSFSSGEFSSTSYKKAQKEKFSKQFVLVIATNMVRICHGWMEGWMDGWVNGWVNGWMDGWVDGWMGGWMDGWVDGWTDGWLGGWMGWMDG